MESDMVNVHEIIKDFFKEKLPYFSLITEHSYFRYWNVTYVHGCLKIRINEEIGIMIDVFINDTKYPLWQYDRSVIDKSDRTENDVLYQLNILKRFIDEVGY
ncbi:hypothetical protein [Viscerimonas tarda]